MSKLMAYDDPRRPVRAVADLDSLDDAEIIEGYRDARDGLSCGGNRSRAYWHGWANGMRDMGKMEQTDESRALAHDYLKAQRSEGPTP